jgi:hypothetical protein
MSQPPRDLVFLSYSRKDPEIYAEVRQRLIDQGLGDCLWDDTEIRLGEQWDPRIQDGMDRTAVAVLILSDGYFGRRQGGGEYILERELPYFIERWQAGELDLLPIYWRPSPHFRPDRREPAKPFEYVRDGAARRFDLHSIQALTRLVCLEDAPARERRDALLDLAADAEERLDARLTGRNRSAAPTQVQGRQALAVELTLDNGGLRRIFKVGGQVVPLEPPAVPRAELDDLRAQADRSLPDLADQARVGRCLYRLLFGARGGEDLFPRLAQGAWDLPPGPTARTIAVAVDLRCDTGADDPWPLRLPWHLAMANGERLAERCGWSFESTPPGLHPRFSPVLSPEPPILLWVDERLPGAVRHGTELTQLLERTRGFAVDLLHCADLGQLAAAARRTPEPEILYVYARADLDLAALAGALAGALGDATPLILLNLVGESLAALPTGLVRGRKVVCALHAAIESERARTAGTQWLQSFLGDSAGIGPQRIAIDSFGPRVRLWSGCAGLETRISAARGRLFRRPLIKLLLDRIGARREASDEVAAALAQGRGVLAMVAAGTAADHPELLPKQVWHHYQHYREAGSRDAIRRMELATGPFQDPAELLVRFAQALGRGSDDWQDGLDDQAGELAPGEHLILSLEWRLPRAPTGQEPGPWREAWLDAWLTLGTLKLADYLRTGVLLVHCLIVETADPAEAEAWTEEAQALWRARRPGLSKTTGGRFAYLRLKPLSMVPVDDVEYFLEHHYRLPEHHPDLDPFAVADWVCAQTGGVFAATVDAVERLHDTGFQGAYDALRPAGA